MTNLEQREERVRQGSRRKRDVEAVKAAAAAERAASVQRTPVAEAAWAAIAGALEARHRRAYGLWLAHLALVGERDEVLVLTAPATVRTWVERRYIDLLVDAIGEHSDYRGFRFCDQPAEGA